MSELLAERYELVRPIGKGGYGDVWLARDTQLRRDVAIKKLSVKDRSQKRSHEKSERFRREAITMAKIEHPSVVTIFDVGSIEDEQELFLVMELLDGRNLYEELALNGPMEPRRALQRFAEALDGLAAAHDQGVVHKDLKPANLFVHRVDTDREEMKLIDFGIARMDSLTKLTGTGRMAGSPRYLAPEYIMGEPVTPAVDIYQVALILVEALTGEACIPSGLEFFEICQRHILNDLRVPDGLLASPLGPVLERSLQRHPAARYQSASEFAQALRSVVPEDLPTFELAMTVEMAAPSFQLELPDSEPTVSAMVEQLRRTEASSQHTAITSRYAGVHERRADAAPTEPPQTVAAAAALSALRQEARVASEREDSDHIRLIVLGGLTLGLLVLASSLVIQLLQPKPEPSRPEVSTQTCLLQCAQWYTHRDELAECQRLCRTIRPPSEPPFAATPAADVPEELRVGVAAE